METQYNLESILEPNVIKSFSKCLISGGYLITLDEFKGIVLKADDYFTSKIVKINDCSNCVVKVSSPQFLHQNQGQISQLFDLQNCFNDEFSLKIDNCNPYVRVPVLLALEYFYLYHNDLYAEILSQNACFNIYLYETKGFINTKHHTNQTLVNAKEIGHMFKDFDSPVEKCEKTGLGSSSGVIVILIKSIFWVFLKESSLDFKNLNKIHMLSQLSNYVIQDKIGSGFDITAAVYGSCLFQRIPKKLMVYLLDIRNNVVQKNRKNDIDESCNELMQKYSDMLNSEVLSKPFSSIGKSLNGSSQEVNISEMIKTVFVQFEKGTNTVDMVKNVMNGLNKAIEDAQTYERLKATNNYIADTMFDILNLKSCIDQQRGVSNECLDLNKQWRLLTKELQGFSGEGSNISKIEPVEASILLDLVHQEMSGDQEIKLLWGVCPGAGGYDDVVFIILGDDDKFRSKLGEIVLRIKSEDCYTGIVDLEVMNNLRVK